MARKKGIALALTAALILTAVNPVFAYKPGADTMRTESRIEGEYVPGEAIICIDPDMVDEKKLAKSSFRLFGSEPNITSSTIMDVSDAVEDLSKEEKASLNYSGDGKAVLKIVKSDTLSTEELISLYSGKKGVLSAEPNYIIRSDDFKDEEVLLTTGTDSGTPDLTKFQYAFKDGKGGMDVPDWNKPDIRNSEGIVVAVIDSGVDYTHEDLKNVMWDEGLKYKALTDLGGGKYGINTGHDHYNGDNPTGPDEVMDYNTVSHGTHCAGVIAAEWNGIGVSGAANGARIMGVKAAFDDYGSFYIADCIEGLNYVVKARELGVKVVAANMSFGSSPSSYVLTLAVAEAGKKGIISCLAASNESNNIEIESGLSSIMMDLPEEITVGAGDADAESCLFSNYGIRTTHLFAPGYDIMSTIRSKMSSAVGDKDISKPVSDSNGNDLYDDLKTPSPVFTYEANTQNGLNMETSDSLMKIRDIKIGNGDDATVETLSGNSPRGAVLLTIKANAPVKKPSEGKRHNLIVKVKPLNKEDQYILCYAKTKDDSWQMTGYLSIDTGSYRYGSFPLPETGDTDFNELTVRLALYDAENSFVSGVDIDELWISDTEYHYAVEDGTSMACPAVAGEAALVAKKFPEDSAAKRAARILAGVKKVDAFKEVSITGGMANVRNSFDESTYTPVVSSISAGRDGLSIKGFFFGEKTDTVVEISQGKNRWSSAEGSLPVIDVKKSAKDTDEIITGIPSSMERNREVIVTVVNKKRPEDRQRFSRYLMPSDPDRVLKGSDRMYERIDLDDSVYETLAGTTFTAVVPIDNRFRFFGNYENDQVSDVFDPEKGIFTPEEPLPATGRMTGYNGRLLYVDKNEKDEGQKLVFLKGSKKEKETPLKISGDRIEGAESWVYEAPGEKDYFSDLYYDGRDLLYFRYRGEYSDDDKLERTDLAVYSLDPDTGLLTFLGRLNIQPGTKGNAYGMGFISISHEEKEGKPNTIYVMGFTGNPDGTEKLFMEKFTAKKGFTSEVIKNLPSRDFFIGKSVDPTFWSACGVRNGIYLAGFIDEVSGNGVPAEIEADNYFFDYSHPEEGFKPCEKKIYDTRIYVPLVFAAYGRVYFWGMTKDGFVLSYTEADTLPNYGDTEKPKKNPDGSWEYTKAQKEALNMSLLPTRKIPIKGTDKELEMSLKAAQTVKYTRFKKELTDSILDKEGSGIKIGDNKIGIKKVVLKNPKKAYVSENSIFRDTITEDNMTVYASFAEKKRPSYYIVLSTKGLPKEIKQAVKKANKQLKKELFPVDILPFTLTTANVKLDKLNKKKNKVKKVSVLDEKERKTKLKASSSGKKDYKSRVDENFAIITGTNNYDGEVKISTETGK